MEGNENEDSFFHGPADSSSAKTAPSAANPFEDDGEPDFAGWLAAQAGKKTGAKPLPKGLAKPANGRPVAAGRSATTGSTGKPAAASVVKPKPKPVVAKKVDTAPKETGEEDGWGDGW